MLHYYSRSYFGAVKIVVALIIKQYNERFFIPRDLDHAKIHRHQIAPLAEKSSAISLASRIFPVVKT